MSALPQPDLRDFDAYWGSQVPQQKQPIANSSVTSHQKKRHKTTQLSRKKHSSARLQLLTLLQKSSSGLAAVMMLGSIAVYLSTVRIPQLWSQEYETLEALQRQERDLVAVDEALKYEIARQAAQSELEMSAISPQNTVFLTPNSVKPQVAKADTEKTKLWQVNRLGY